MALMITTLTSLVLFVKVLIVAGGKYNVEILSSVEIFEGESWRFIRDLPRALEGLTGINLDNTVFMIGKNITDNPNKRCL